VFPLRRVPPVHAAIRASALWRAARVHFASSPQPESSAIALATERLSEVYPDREILLTSNGTSALMLALQATKSPTITRACVALPAYACPDIGSAAIGAGYQIVLYDVVPSTLEPDFESLRRCLDAGATHVVAVHLFGRLVDVPEIQQLAALHGAVVIEDAAQHAGGMLRGVRGGALADWSTLSFGRGKGINAGGGGALMRRLAGAGRLPAGLPTAGVASSLVGLAKATAAELLSHPAVYWMPSGIPALQLGETVYHAPEHARTMTMSSAMLLVEALDREPQALAARQMAERRYLEALTTVKFRGTSVMLGDAAHGMASGALRVPVHLPDRVAAALSGLGVARSYPRTLADYPEIAGSVMNASEPIPGARTLADSLYTLPTHARLRDVERVAIIRALQVMHE